MRVALILLLVVPLTGRADDGKALAPFLDDRAFAVLRLDLTKVDVPQLFGRLTAGMKRQSAYLTLAEKDATEIVSGLVKDGAGVVYVVASLADVVDGYPFLVVPL